MSYKKFIFDNRKRRFLGKFEEMYRAEDDKKKFDSWYESDLKCLRKTISLEVLSSYNFKSILDVGCGKGNFIHLLKKRNNKVMGIDISPTAISRAKASFPGVSFCCMDAKDIKNLNQRFDLIVVMGLFAYIKQWCKVVKDISTMTRYFYIAEYVPKNCIGFVKNGISLEREVKKYFRVVDKVVLNNEHHLFFAEIKKG